MSLPTSPTERSFYAFRLQLFHCFCHFTGGRSRTNAQDAGEKSRSIQGGGITVPGWTGKIDANEEKAGQTINDAKFAKQGNEMQVTTGPAVTYWNPANTASGNYT